MQNINLYLPEFRKKKSWLDAEKTVLIAGAGIVLLVIASGIEYFQLAQMRSEVAATEQEYTQVAAATAALVAQYGTQTEDPALLASIRSLEEDLQSKQALLQFLEGRELGNAEGFSEYLADLSRHHVQGLSLDHVSLTEGGHSVELGGQVLKAELALLFLQELRKGSAYLGMEFESVELDRVTVAAAAATPDAPDIDAQTWRIRSLKQ